MPGFGKDNFGKREVTEFDLRAPEFKHPDLKPSDYEFRNDGKIVRKDRWERGMHSIAEAAGFTRRSGFEIDDVVSFTEKTFAALENIDHNHILDIMQRARKELERQIQPRTNTILPVMKDMDDAIGVLSQTALALAKAVSEDTDKD